MCGHCVHFQPYRDEVTKRVHPSKRGRCGWKPTIQWAMAYRRSGYNYGREQDPVIYPCAVWKHTDAATCACFVERKGAVERKGDDGTH